MNSSKMICKKDDPWSMMSTSFYSHSIVPNFVLQILTAAKSWQTIIKTNSFTPKNPYFSSTKSGSLLPENLELQPNLTSFMKKNLFSLEFSQKWVVLWFPLKNCSLACGPLEELKKTPTMEKETRGKGAPNWKSPKADALLFFYVFLSSFFLLRLSLLFFCNFTP